MEEHAVVFSGRRGRREGVGEGFSKEEQRFSEKHRTGTERRRGGIVRGNSKGQDSFKAVKSSLKW